MRPWGVAFALLGPVVLGGATPPAACSPEAIEIEAGLIEMDLANRRARAEVDARLSYAGLELRAERITADGETGQVDASEGVEIVQDGRRLRGAFLTYNLYAREGVLRDARAVLEGLFIGGREIAFSSRRVDARDAYVTTCDRPDPHYSFGAEHITVVADEPAEGGPPAGGRLTLDRTRVTYRGRRLFTLPRYTVGVGEIGEPGKTPLPATGFSRDDGPYVEFGYAFAEIDDKTTADFSYRYTTDRGIRGYLRTRRELGAVELLARYVRREDPADRELRIDDLEASLADVLVDREPEFGLRLAGYEIGSSLDLDAYWLGGSYSEQAEAGGPTLASADRFSMSALLSVKPYAALRGVQLSHAIGYRRSRYDPGDTFRVGFVGHAVDTTINPRVRLKLTHISRHGSGETPFLFDGIGPESELLADVRWRVLPGWGLRVVGDYDLQESDLRDMLLEVTRIAHCLEYSFVWKKKRGTFYFSLGLADLPGPE